MKKDRKTSKTIEIVKNVSGNKKPLSLPHQNFTLKILFIIPFGFNKSYYSFIEGLLSEKKKWKMLFVKLIERHEIFLERAL